MKDINKVMTYRFMLTISIVLLKACQSSHDVLSPKPDPLPPTQGMPTETGKPVGEALVRKIGPAGGAISTPDQKFTLLIPAGAVSQETTVTIQPVENKAWSGTGLAYEIRPKNLELAKPAQLVWNYSDADLAGSSPDALGIAFQQGDNSWLGRGNVSIDKEKQKASTPVTKLLTAAFFEQYYMVPGVGSVAPAERQQFDVLFHPGYNERGEDWIPLVRSVLKSTEVKNWRINGIDQKGGMDPLVGGLSPIKDGASAMYTAPNHIPKNNSVAVSVEVILPGMKAKLILISNLTIAGDNNFKINGSKVDSADVILMTVADGKLFQIALAEPQIKQSKQATVNLNILPFAGAGPYEVGASEMVTMQAYDRNAKRFSESYTPVGGKPVYGPMTVFITEYDAAKKMVAGNFTGTMHYYDDKTNKHETVSVSASFRAASPY